MQNTRLTIITNQSINRLETWFNNPWRRLSLYIITLLFGFLLASLVSTIAGATSVWDPYIAGVLVILFEAISWLFYRLGRRSLFLDCLNLLKIGMLFGLILEAFKLGS